MDVSVIILNYNTFQLTCECIQSVIDETKDLNYEIILVDNASTECLPNKFKERFPDILLIQNKENIGFARGNNSGIIKASGDFVLLLNSDTKLINNAIKITLDYLKTFSKVAVVSAKLVFPNGNPQSVCQRFPSIKYKLIELFRFHKLVSKQKAGRLLLGSFFNYNENTTADWIWGTYFMFKKSLLIELPGQKLDDSLFMYGEDMQWCFDFKKKGYQIHFCHEAKVIHYLGSSKGNAKEMINKNLTAFLLKNYSKIHMHTINFLNSILKRT
jgi:GT2 family glycosyltransferase